MKYCSNIGKLTISQIPSVWWMKNKGTPIWFHDICVGVVATLSVLDFFSPLSSFRIAGAAEKRESWLDDLDQVCGKFVPDRGPHVFRCTDLITWGTFREWNMGLQYTPADYFLPRSLTDGDFMWLVLRGLMMEGHQLTQTNSCRGRIRIAHFWTSYLASRVCFWNRPVALGTSGHPSSQTPSLAWPLSANGLYRVSSWTSSELIDKKVITNLSVAAIAINQPSFLGHVLAFHWLIYFWWLYARDFGRCEVEPHQWKTERSWRLHCCGLHWLQMLSSWNSEGNPPPRVKASWGLGDNFNNQIGEDLLSIYSPYVLNILCFAGSLLGFDSPGSV